jgi:hypothetical protein
MVCWMVEFSKEKILLGLLCPKPSKGAIYCTPENVFGSRAKKVFLGSYILI